MKNVVKILKALSDENRLKIVNLLEKGELCVCDLQEHLGLSQPAVSHHLKVLYNAGIIDYVKEGLFVNYKLYDRKKGTFTNKLTKFLLEALSEEGIRSARPGSGKQKGSESLAKGINEE